jgi:protein-L-isoaspartate(D-aspartate) O-methyltransferase
MAALAAGCGGGGAGDGAEGPPRPDSRPAPPRSHPFPPEPPHRAEERRRMVEGCVRALGVTDARVLAAMAAVPRHLFVPAEVVESSYDDTPLPIGHGQTISAPDIVGYMSQAVGVGPGSRVLDVGTGSGYQAAVLAEMGCRVHSVEIVEALAREADARLRGLGYRGVTVRCGDGYEGWPGEAPFDAIVVAAAPPEVPPRLVEQLRPGGRMVIPVGEQGAAQRMLVLTKRADGGVDSRETLAVRFVPLVPRK